MQLLSITMNCKYPLGMFKNVSLVQNESLHVKYLPNVNSLEIIWSSFVLLILIKKREKSWKIRKIKILKSPQIQVKLVLDWNCSFEFASYEQCYRKVLPYRKYFDKCQKAATRGALKNFAKFTGNHLCQSLFFNKIKLQTWGPQLYWKGDPSAGVFLWILLNF